MKLFFIYSHHSPLADSDNLYFKNVREALLATQECTEVQNPEKADALIIKELFSFKDFSYIKKLIQDPLISRYAAKVFTINDDDCATGLLKGVYTCIHKSKLSPNLHAAMPHIEYPNKYVLEATPEYQSPKYLAGWYGSTHSNKLRSALVKKYEQHPHFNIKTLRTWVNHHQSDREAYVPLLQSAKFSLCPPGWAATSFRIFESMAVGRCPVIFSSEFIPPKGPDWTKAALFFTDQRLDRLEVFLQRHEHQFVQKGQYSRDAWMRYFHPNKVSQYYAQNLLQLIEKNMDCTNEMELARWNSLHMFWVNKWTVPQRVINKVRQLAA